ncbi:fumarylacetoacetate hydrolase family protein [Achromobacter aloeverae]|uniref:2-keto-4-pentenoate hydratase n=1 Tax=Achromobacter aloeverae TaxID=1750518 RepID=A0A4Q1HIV5_9BURK|nr:fumarylacetoacetate hydrolase family protein [Achromobacter aloeverae]RXN88069.1 2-keto-4-pentenoate hydratase [Achromobacter aloeverae]
MRLATFSVPGDGHATRVGALCEDRMLDLVECARALQPKLPFPTSMRGLLETGEDGLGRTRGLLKAAASDQALLARFSHGADAIKLLPPVPDADKFLCVGKNYRSHLEELKRTDLIKELPQEPTGFVKLNSCLVGHDSEVERPESVARLDYEPELVFVIGKRVESGAPGDPLDYIAGITLLNDLTCRDTQKKEVASGTRFWTSKNAPGFGPMGPCIITMDEVPDPYDLWVTCSVNGELRMRVNTVDQIWKLGDILKHFSRLLALQPGDMFSTGAPGGVAVGKANAEALFLRPGDIVECGFEAPAMTLRTKIVAPR